MEKIYLSKKHSRKRLFVITVSFVSAAVVALAAWGALACRDSARYRQQLRYSCERALYELSLHLEEMNISFTKSAYSSTPEGFGTLAAGIYESGGYAKACITQMPTGSISLDSTYRYLSQSSEYMNLMGKNVASGYELDEDDRKTMKSLAETARKLSARISEIRDSMNDGVTWEDDADEILYGDGGENTDFYGYMTEIEDMLSSGDSLVYEGSYSENRIHPTSAMLEAASPASEEQAKKQAAAMLKAETSALTRTNDETGSIEAYGFSGADGSYITVTKSGAFPVYFIRETGEPGEAVLSEDAAAERALAFLSENGLGDMTEIRRSGGDGQVVFTFAPDGTVLVYSDIVKVAVSLDKGTVTGFDARQYILNHRARDYPEPAHSSIEATAVLSPLLTLKNARLTTVPTVPLSETVAWEMTCESQDGQSVIVYIGADDLSEKLILLKDEGTVR